MSIKITGSQFKTEFCLPMKRREIWLTNQKLTKFPELWPVTPACSRLERILASNSGRAKILNCIKAGVSLSGDPKNPEVRGIEECHVVIDELLRIRADKLQAKKEVDTTTTPPSDSTQPGGVVPGAGGVVTGAGGGAPSDDADGLSFFETETEDPVEQKVNELCLKEMMHINSFTDIDKLLDEVEETVSREPVEQPHPTD